MKTIAALFDCDGTLYSAQFGRGLMRYAADHGRKGRTRAVYASLVWPSLLRKLKLISDEKFQAHLMDKLTTLLTGMTEVEGRAMFDWTWRKYLLPTQRPEVLTRLRAHQAQGHPVVLVSAQYRPCLEILGADLRVTAVIGTELEVEAGHYTGRFLPPLLTGEAKGTHTRALFAARAMEVDWAASYAYADSITDTGLFNLVGHPIAVYPDAKLHALAQTNSWEILGTPKV